MVAPPAMTTPFRKPRRCNAAGSSVMVNPPVFLALQARGLKFLYQCKKRLLHRRDIIQIARSGAYAWRICLSSKRRRQQSPAVARAQWSRSRSARTRRHPTVNYSAMGFSRKLVWYRIEGSLCDRSADAYFAAEKRLSNEFDDTIGWAPATRLPAGAGAAAVSVSVTDGFSGGRAVASFVSAFGAAVFGIDASFRLASTVFGLVGTGAGAAAVAVV